MPMSHALIETEALAQAGRRVDTTY